MGIFDQGEERGLPVPGISGRNMKGSGIAEGVVGMILVIGVTIFAVVLLLNAGAAAYNKEKLGFVTNAAATYATNLTDYGTRQALVADRVNNMLASMSLTPDKSTVTVTDMNVGKLPAVSVTVSLTLPTMLSSNFNSILPQAVQLTDTAVALKPRYYWGDGLGMLPTGQNLIFPLVNTTGALPDDGKPAYAITVAAMFKVR